MTTIRISMSEDEFRRFVRGEIVRQVTPEGHAIEIALQDIGRIKILDAVGVASLRRVIKDMNDNPAS